ncbi:putative ribonuclease H-like domain-containing protein [Tanacetum coccineum]
MSLGSTFIASRFLNCPSAPLVVSSVGIGGTPIVTGQMANSVALMAFGSTWTIVALMPLHFRGSCVGIKSFLMMFVSPVTTEEEAQKKNDVKARMLLAQSLDFIFNMASVRLLKELQAQAQVLRTWLLCHPFISTNEVNTAYGVSTANTQVSPASTQVSTACTQVSTANLNDIEEMDLEMAVSIAEHEDKKVFLENWWLLIGAGFDWSVMAVDDSPYKHGSRITDKSRKGVGFVSYNVVPPPPTGLFSPPKVDLSNSGLEEFQQPEFEGYKPKLTKEVNTARLNSAVVNAVRENQGHPQKEDQGYVDSGCSRHMTGNMSYLLDFKEFDGGYVTFRGGAKGGKITSKGTLKTGKLDFEDVYFVKELQFNLFSVLQMCDKKNCVLFTETECFVLSPDFKLTDESQVLLKVPRKNNMYSVDIKNIVPKESLTCLVAKATLDESMLWHRRLGHVNFKTINKHVKENLVRGLPSKRFENNQTCVACLKGKQHKASCMSKIQNSITQPLFMLHMDLFGLTFMSSLMNNKYFLVVTDDYSRFTWVFFLATKDEASGIHKSFITEIENLVDKKIKIIRCDNGTEFKNKVMSVFCEQKGIKREFSIARTPQQNGVAERRNRTLIEAARTILEYVTIINTLDYLGKFDGKSDEGFFVGYSLISDGPKWLFDIEVLTKSMNDVPVVAGLHFDACRKMVHFLILLQRMLSNDEPQTFRGDAGKKDDESVNKESGIDGQERPENSSQDVNTARPSINTASTIINTGSLNINIVSPTITTAPLEATHADFFGDETKVDMSNITTAYPVPSTLNIRTHKDHSLNHVIGDVQSGVLTRRMTKTTNEQGFISVVYEGKTHEDLHACVFACFLS